MDAWIPLLGYNVYYRDLYELNPSSLRLRRRDNGRFLRTTCTGRLQLMGTWVHIADVVRDHRAFRSMMNVTNCDGDDDGAHGTHGNAHGTHGNTHGTHVVHASGGGAPEVCVNGDTEEDETVYIDDDREKQDVAINNDTDADDASDENDTDYTNISSRNTSALFNDCLLIFVVCMMVSIFWYIEAVPEWYIKLFKFR